MSKEKLIPIALRNPDKIMLHYGNKKIELRIAQGFSNYIVSVKESELENLKPYLAKGDEV